MSQFKLATVVILLLQVLGPSHSLAAKAASEKPPANRGIDFVWGVKIPMRDGIHLNATIYKPKQTKNLPRQSLH